MKVTFENFGGHMLATNRFSMLKIPVPVGYWILGAEAAFYTAFAMYRRPTDEQIANTEALLGWTWKDAPLGGVAPAVESTLDSSEVSNA